LNILIIGQTDNPQLELSFKGGAERAERCQISALSKKHDVTFLTPADSDDFSSYPFKVVKFSEASRGSSKIGRGYYEKISGSIRKTLDSQKFDLVISNSKRSALIKKTNEIHHPKFIHVLHILPQSYGMTGIDLFVTLMDAKKAGKIVFAVSEYASEKINQFGNSAKYLKDINYSGDLTEKEAFPVVYTKNHFIAKEPKNGVINISRMASEKKLKMSFELFSKIKNSSITCSMTPNDTDGEEEYSSIIPLVSYKDKLLLDQSYEVVMDNLAISGVNFSSCPKESFGIVNFEAMERGVPTITNYKEGHASDTFLKGAPFYFPMDTFRKRTSSLIPIFEDLTDKALNLTLKDRQSLADYAYEEFNENKFIEKIERLAEGASTHKPEKKIFTLF
jgi:glycosyltransferase involved in cell wall biosynthesis